MLLAGEWVDRPKTIDVRDPFDNSLVDTVPAATHDDVEAALAAAAAATATARRMTTYERPGPLQDRRDRRRPARLRAHHAREGSKTIREGAGAALRQHPDHLAEEAKRRRGSSPSTAPGGEAARHYTRERSAWCWRSRRSTTRSTWSPTSSDRRSPAATR
jgi:glyceraldehyde-3-phosphate dehydrogenase (NADP+)